MQRFVVGLFGFGFLMLLEAVPVRIDLWGPLIFPNLEPRNGGSQMPTRRWEPERLGFPAAALVQSALPPGSVLALPSWHLC